ncbi:PPOX class F420-dependent oxidoreductase [Streptomyces sp. NPDC001380]|uniref:PPOX class F420-dependent oxidoreductase n=1 Tax=Streptomyces sp. NPDC001380 TaxID=3364566 RepID=UPI00367E09A8
MTETPSAAPWSEAEQEYLLGQRLGRLATLGPDGAPQSRPVVYTVNADLGTIDIGGLHLAASRKFRNIQADPRVSFVVDDLASTDPWSPRGVEIRGVAAAVAPGSPDLPPAFPEGLIRITPRRILGWGLDTGAFAPPHARDV